MNKGTRNSGGLEFIAIILETSNDTSKHRALLNNVRAVAKKLVVVLSDSTLFGAFNEESELTRDVFLKFNANFSNDGARALQEGLEEALAQSSKTDHYLIVKNGLDNPLPVGKIQTTAESGSDFHNTESWMLLSRKYAEFIVKTKDTPSISDAMKNGFAISMSLSQMIVSPKEAIRANWTLIKFMMVGASGLLVNLIVLTLLRPWSTGLSGTVVTEAIAVELSIINNFTWNEIFTFSSRNKSPKHETKIVEMKNSLTRLGKYNLISVSTFTIQLTVFTFLKEFANVNYILSSIVAVGFSFSINYLASSRWTWKRKTRHPDEKEDLPAPKD